MAEGSMEAFLVEAKNSLQDALLTNSTEGLGTYFDSSSEEKKQLLELVFRSVLRESLSGDRENTQKIVDFSMDFVRSSVVEIHLPLLLIEQWIESVPVLECKQVWEYLESPIAHMSHFSTDKKSKLILLRLANRLLARLSSDTDSLFRGRILSFLSCSFPLSDPSGVNMRGAINIDNETYYEDEENSTISEKLECQDSNGQSADLARIDYKLYCTFWSLQKPLKHAAELYHTNESWIQFRDDLSSILDVFQTPSSFAQFSGLPEEDMICSSKYLTSGRLLPLQLKDPLIRRNFLVQILIVLQSIPTDKKQKLDKIVDLEKRVHSLLRSTGKPQNHFDSDVSRILEREKNYSKWKIDRCPPLEKKIEETRAPKRSLCDLSSINESKKKRALYRWTANSVLQPWGSIDRLAQVSEETIPDPKMFLETYAIAMDPENGIEEDYHPKKDSLYCWRAVRLLSKDNLDLFENIVAGPDKIIECAVQKHQSQDDIETGKLERKTELDAEDGEINEN